MGTFDKLSDEQIEHWIFSYGALYVRGALKAVVIGFMSFFSVAVFTGSPLKAVGVSSMCFVAGLFMTWRRYLEPVAFVLFCLSILYWCDQESAALLKNAILNGVGAIRG